MSKIIFCTSRGLLSRYISWYTGGFSHVALILPNGNWLDARFGGVQERKPEKNLLHKKIIELPFDIEPAFRQFLGQGYNFKGVLGQWIFHCRWRSPGRLFCDQGIFAAFRISGHPVIAKDREDRVPPQAAYDIISAYLQGMLRAREIT